MESNNDYGLAASSYQSKDYVFWGIKYLKGEGVPEDNQKAFEYFKTAVSMGDGEGMAYLGVMYQYGYGVAVDYDKALTYYNMSANKLCGHGEFRAGFLYLNADSLSHAGKKISISGNLYMAVRLFKRAKAHGYNDPVTAGLINGILEDPVSYKYRGLLTQGYPDIGMELFNKAIALKRQGKYPEAVVTYIESVTVYPDDPEVNEVFRAIGKSCYLAKVYDLAIIAYENAFIRSLNNDFIKDYVRCIQTNYSDINLATKVYVFMEAHGRNLGHALLDSSAGFNERSAIEIYKRALGGDKTVGYNPNTDYESKCADRGVAYLDTLLKEFLVNKKGCIDKMMRRLPLLMNPFDALEKAAIN